MGARRAHFGELVRHALSRARRSASRAKPSSSPWRSHPPRAAWACGPRGAPPLHAAGAEAARPRRRRRARARRPLAPRARRPPGTVGRAPATLRQPDEHWQGYDRHAERGPLAAAREAGLPVGREEDLLRGRPVRHRRSAGRRTPSWNGTQSRHVCAANDCVTGTRSPTGASCCPSQGRSARLTRPVLAPRRERRSPVLRARARSPSRPSFARATGHGSRWS